jgi:hypothetical protein
MGTKVQQLIIYKTVLLPLYMEVQLIKKFIYKSLMWTNNSYSTVRKVNPKFDYSEQALNGVLKWWLSKKNIRTNLAQNSVLLQRVFALQDKKI